MTLYPCPLCGKVPEVSTTMTPAGVLWMAFCDCFGVHGESEASMAYSWATYCVKMAEEVDDEAVRCHQRPDKARRMGRRREGPGLEREGQGRHVEAEAMSQTVTDCRYCAKAYLSDARTTGIGFLDHIEVLCSVPRDHPIPHVASFMGVTERPCVERCKAFEPLAGPPRVWPPRDDRMRKEGRFWSDVVAEARAEPQTKLEAWL